MTDYFLTDVILTFVLIGISETIFLRVVLSSGFVSLSTTVLVLFDKTPGFAGTELAGVEPGAGTGLWSRKFFGKTPTLLSDKFSPSHQPSSALFLLYTLN